MTALDDLKAAGIECFELREYQPFRNQHTISSAIAGHPVVRQDKADAAIEALARIAIGLKQSADSWAMSCCGAMNALDRAEDLAIEYETKLSRARNLAVGLEQECERLRGMLAQGEAEA